MESFQITTSLSESKEVLLVIPEDCAGNSIFHIVKDGDQYCKLRYTDQNEWELLPGAQIKPEELQEITARIEEHFS